MEGTQLHQNTDSRTVSLSCPPPSGSVLLSPVGTENATRSQPMPCSCAVLSHDEFFPFGQSLQRKTGRKKVFTRKTGKLGRVVCLRSQNVYAQSGAQASLRAAWKKKEKNSLGFQGACDGQPLRACSDLSCQQAMSLYKNKIMGRESNRASEICFSEDRNSLHITDIIPSI